MKKLHNQKTFNVLVLAALIIMGAAIYLTFCRINTQAKLQDELSKSQSKVAAIQAAINSNNASFKLPVVSVSENVVYIPEMRIKLPLDEQSLSINYSVREVGNAKGITGVTYDVATRDFLNNAPYVTTSVSACVPVRLAFESKPNPYNPHEHPQKAVTLSDGRTLQIYATSDDSCHDAWTAGQTDPLKLAALFQKAGSY